MAQLANLQVLFQDAALLAINKPAGLATLPDGYDPSLPHIKSILQQQYGQLWIVHRLDKNTSGVLLLARTAGAHRSLNTQFEQHTVTKVYHALAHANPGWDEKTVDLPLRLNGDRQHRTVIDPEHGKSAITHFTVLERLGSYCLIQAIPETGRTHQIRAHIAALGIAILGDVLYRARIVNGGPRQSESVAGGQESGLFWSEGIALHAWSLEVDHPITGERQVFRAPYSEYWLSELAKLRTLASAR